MEGGVILLSNHQARRAKIAILHERKCKHEGLFISKCKEQGPKNIILYPLEVVGWCSLCPVCVYKDQLQKIESHPPLVLLSGLQVPLSISLRSSAPAAICMAANFKNTGILGKRVVNQIWTPNSARSFSVSNTPSLRFDLTSSRS